MTKEKPKIGLTKRLKGSTAGQLLTDVINGRISGEADSIKLDFPKILSEFQKDAEDSYDPTDWEDDGYETSTEWEKLKIKVDAYIKKSIKAGKHSRERRDRIAIPIIRKLACGAGYRWGKLIMLMYCDWA